jgi:hypothetical protein
LRSRGAGKFSLTEVAVVMVWEPDIFAEESGETL